MILFAFIIVSLIVIIICIIAFRWVVQNNRITSTTGDQDISFGNDNKLFRTEEEVLYVNLFKKQGIASTVLRPSGKVTIEGRTYSAEADEQFIEEGSKVQITKIQGNKITVKII